MRLKTIILSGALPLGLASITISPAVATMTASTSAAEQGAAVAEQLRKRNAGYGSMQAKLEMRLRNAHGQQARRAMRIRSLERPAADEGDLSIVVFDSPSDVRGTALLSHAGVLKPDNQWLYMPAIKRVRRISTRNTSGPFMGSEFSYEDITGNEVGKYTWTMLGTESCGGDTCYKLENHPRYERSGYTRRVVWVDKSEYRILRVDFYDRKNTKLKTLNYTDYRKYAGKYWRAHTWTMVNHQSGKSTTLQFDGFDFNAGLKASDFTQKALESIR